MSEKFFVLNSRGQKIIGTADYQRSRAPAVIICHGFKGFKELPLLKVLSEKLFQRGFAVFRFDFTNGLGESAGSMEDITITQELDDLKAVVNFVYTNLNVDKSRIGLTGHSLGGLISVLYASSDNKIRAVSPIAAVMKLELTPAINQGLPFVLKWKKQGFQIFHSYSKNIDVRVNYSFYEDGKKYNGLEASSKLKIPVFFANGDKDEAVPSDHTKKMYGAAKEPKKLLVVKGSDHDFSKKEHLKEVTDKVAEWFGVALKPGGFFR